MKFHPEFVSKIFLNLNDQFGKVLESRWFKFFSGKMRKKVWLR